MLIADIDSGIMDVHSLIHKVAMTADISKTTLMEKLGPFHSNNKYIPEKRNPAYRKHAFRCHTHNEHKFNLNLFYDPYSPSIFPFIKLEFSSPSQEFLLKLFNLIPELNFSLIEYTSDFRCRSSVETRALFFAFLHFGYFPYVNETKLKIEQDSKNLTFYAGTQIRGYEKNENKKGKKCSEEELNVLRVEYTLEGDNLTNKELRNPTMFIEDTKFYPIVSKAIQLKSPGPRSNYLPREWEPYFALTNEIAKIRQNPESKNVNPTQYLHDLSGLEHLQAMWKVEMIRFDHAWKEKGKELVKPI
jgi:hypothetical protein